MAESIENLDNILRDRAKDKMQKGLADAFNRIEKAGRRKIKLLLLKNNAEKILEQSQSAVERD